MRLWQRRALAALAACALLLPAASAAESNQSPSEATKTFDASSRHLAEPASWTPWPSRSVKNLEIVHNLCDPDWIEALEVAAREWTARSSAVNLKVTPSNCISRDNADLTYYDNVIRVVYGTCGSDCCGKAKVSYSYKTMQDGRRDITKYSSVVRLDRTCFNRPGHPQYNQLGRQYLACHELGHAIGLGHNNDEFSCLNDFRPDNYLPGPDDLRVLDNVLYPDAASTFFQPAIPSFPVARPPVLPPTMPRVFEVISAPAQPTPRPQDVSSGGTTLSSVPNSDCEEGQCGLCQGDCDSDSHCQYGLKCFFRSNRAPNPPGCEGQAVSSVDYCYDPNTPVPAPRPTPTPPTLRPATPSPPTLPPPTGQPNIIWYAPPSPQPPALQPTYAFPNPQFQIPRQGTLPRPQYQLPSQSWYSPPTPPSPSTSNSQSFPSQSWYSPPTPMPPPPSSSYSQSVPSQSWYSPPTQAPPSPSSLSPYSRPGTWPLILVNARPPFENCSDSLLCGQCEGDCDSDSHCRGNLKCFQRSGTEAVPGCQGGYGMPGRDFCYDAEATNRVGGIRGGGMFGSDDFGGS